MTSHRLPDTGLGVGLALLLVALVALVAPAVAAAQEEGQEPPAAEGVAAPPASEPVPPSAEPFDPAAATDAYLARLSGEERARSDAYFEGGYWLQLWGFLYGLGVAWLLLGTGLSRRMRLFAERITKRRPLVTALYAVQYVIFVTIVSFPLTVYAGFFREHKYDLATQTFGPWFKEQLIGLAVGLVLASILLVPLYGVFRRAPKSWWVIGAGLAVLFLILMLLIAPVYIDPLFNTYEPLADASVEGPILSMARANGIAVDNVWEFDASRQTKRISANVSGFAGTMRIRLNDNLLDRCTLPEIKAVMAHEIGHYALNHIYESIIFLGVVMVVGFAFVRFSFDRIVARLGSSWGVRGIADPAGLPLLAALMSIYFFALTPVMNSYIRVNEAEADLFGLNAAREPEGFAEVALKLGEYRKLDPSPLEEMLMFDHPSGRSRIEMAMEWKAENLE